MVDTKVSGIACIGVVVKAIGILVGAHMQFVALGTISKTIPLAVLQAAVPLN